MVAPPRRTRVLVGQLDSVRDTGPLSSFATEEWMPRDWRSPSWWPASSRCGSASPGVAWLYGLGLLAFLMTAYSRMSTCCRSNGGVPYDCPGRAGSRGKLVAATAGGQLHPHDHRRLGVAGTTRDLRPRWWLVPLTWIWASSHGMWYCGIAVGIVVVVGLTMDQRVNIRQALTLASVPALSMMAAGRNTGGTTIVAHVVRHNGHVAVRHGMATCVVPRPRPPRSRC